jgi:hypothetical protein
VKYAYQESPHSENTASPRIERVESKREHVFIRISISNKTPQIINENENPWGYRLGTVNVKTICHWGFKPGSRMHEPHTCPNRLSYQQTSTSCLGEITPTHPSAQQCQSTQTFKTIKANSIAKKKKASTQ